MRHRSLVVAVLCVACGAGAASAGAVQLTDRDRQRLVAHLEMTGRWFVDEVTGLTLAQLAFKRTPDEWSIAQVIDHLLVVGPIYWDDLHAALKSPAGSRRSANSDADILWYGIDRTFREKAIPTEVPTGRVRDLTSALAEYRKNHERLLDYIKTTKDDLRAHVVARQGSDAYQWALLISTHEQRHVLQIREIKSAKAFPRK
jgi:hypothetical protein